MFNQCNREIRMKRQKIVTLKIVAFFIPFLRLFLVYLKTTPIVCTLLLRVVDGKRSTFTIEYVAGLIKLPMTYNMCTGTLPPDKYGSSFTEKCDQDNNSLEIVTSVVYSVIFLLFGSAVVYESVKGKAHSTQQVDPNCNIQVNIVIRHWMVSAV